MAAIQRTASAVWRGELKTGSGAISATSGVLRDTPFSYATRFENARVEICSGRWPCVLK